MKQSEVHSFVENVLENIPSDWLNLTTHRLDIYNESLAKTEFLEQFEVLFQQNNTNTSALNELPTAFDYIRLGHPLSSVLEWTIAKLHGMDPEAIVSFSSNTMPILAVLRKNLFQKRNTLIAYQDTLPKGFDAEELRRLYNYSFEVMQVEYENAIPDFDGSIIYLTKQETLPSLDHTAIDFLIQLHDGLGSIILVNGEQNQHYIAEIQHVRRRESIAMTPADCFSALKMLLGKPQENQQLDAEANKKAVISCIHDITATTNKTVVGSSGLSIQYAIMMGLVDDALKNHPGKTIEFIVPTNCYGGTNDQARRVAACSEQVDVVDLHVDGDNDMVQSIDAVLEKAASEDAIPYIIAEIPTNPRVEVPELNKLKEVLSKERKTPNGSAAIDPVFILDQTFCPNIQFLKEGGIFTSIRTICYVSGSKFPSGGKCTAGYGVANQKAAYLMDDIEKHLKLCDNEATDLQVAILAEQLPSMNQRIADAYANTRAFVNFIKEELPAAKINFVSEELATEGFTPSVFSLDLPTKGATEEEREQYKRELNLRLITRMITEIPNDSKYCVSYGQLKGCYWTIPATSTQGTTKESDKDYIARVAVSPKMDMEQHKEVFSAFVESI